MDKLVVMNEDDARIEREYQAARQAAHRLADKTNEPSCVIEDADFRYKVVSKHEVEASRILYTATPGTCTYMQYKEEATRGGIAALSHKDWIAGGRLSYDSQLIQTYGEEKAQEMAAKSKHRLPKRKAEVRVVADNPEAPSVDMPTRGKTRQVWIIADSLVKDGIAAARATIIEACIEAGINRATAATQYSAWVRARREA